MRAAQLAAGVLINHKDHIMIMFCLCAGSRDPRECSDRTDDKYILYELCVWTLFCCHTPCRDRGSHPSPSNGLPLCRLLSARRPPCSDGPCANRTTSCENLIEWTHQSNESATHTTSHARAAQVSETNQHCHFKSSRFCIEPLGTDSCRATVSVELLAPNGSMQHREPI